MKPTVLMLGWEYPPVINGGLGIASMGLATALSKLLPVHLILPQTPTIQTEEEGDMQVIGLDQVVTEDLWENTETVYEERIQDLRLSYANIPLSGYETPEELEEKEEEISQMPRRFFALKDLYGRDLPRRILDYSEISIQLAEKLDFDLIHAHDWMTFVAGMELKKKTGKPLVLHVHSLEYDRGDALQKNWVFHLEKQAFEMADLIIPVSHYTAELIREHYGIDAKKIKAIHNALSPVKEYRREKPFKDKLVSFVGRLTSQKDPDSFFEMAMEILEQMDGVRFVVAGKGQALDRLLDKVSQAWIGDKFHFAGFLSREKTLDLLAMTDVCVMPSISEPFGLVALEATQMGAPCVIPYQSGVSEVLLHTPKFQAGNVQEMAALTLSLLQNPAYHDEILQKNKASIKELTWEVAAAKIKHLYDSL